MSHYIMINRTGQNCGVKALTDQMADRLAAKGWQVIPTDAPKIRVAVWSKIGR